MAILSLDSIIWELVPYCNRNCDYCGSKNVINQNVDKTYLYDNIEIIANEILKYPPKELTLSGGEPLMYEHIEDICKKLSEKMKVSIITNGDYIDKYPNLFNYCSNIGMSLNYPLEFKDNGIKTFITNFGLYNIFYFDEIFEIVKNNHAKIWQIQLTHGKYQLNKTGMEYLYSKLQEFGINDSVQNNVTQCDNTYIVLADNLQFNHQCTAGVNSLGILYDGSVVACLSERCWTKPKVFDNILWQSYDENHKKVDRLKNIWENGFNERRFKDCKCCRDCFDYPDIKFTDKLDVSKSFKPYVPELPDLSKVKPIFPEKQNFYLYGCPQYDTFSPGTETIIGDATNEIIGDF